MVTIYIDLFLLFIFLFATVGYTGDISLCAEPDECVHAVIQYAYSELIIMDICTLL